MDPVQQMVPLAGTMLHTLGQRRPFDVLSLNPEGRAAIAIRVASTGNIRVISRRDVKAGYALAGQLPRGAVKASMLRAERACEADPA
jgi:hypothetical protein